jgi:hypothetical protein
MRSDKIPYAEEKTMKSFPVGKKGIFMVVLGLALLIPINVFAQQEKGSVHEFRKFLSFPAAKI